MLIMKTFIFDYDDTLAPNTHYYGYAQIAFLEYILDRLGYKAPNLQSIMNLEIEIDKNRVKKLGFSRKRFPGSLMETYKVICKSKNYSFTNQELTEVYNIGKQAFDISPCLIDGAEEVLNFLLEKEDELILYTKGDKVIQQHKIDINHIQYWFKEIHIVNEKNKNDLEIIVGKRDKDRTFKVGNSIRSDVNPALEVGLKVIYIPCETWAYEDEHSEIDKSNPRIHIFQDIRDIIINYDEL